MIKTGLTLITGIFVGAYASPAQSIQNIDPEKELGSLVNKIPVNGALFHTDPKESPQGRGWVYMEAGQSDYNKAGMGISALEAIKSAKKP